VNISTSSGAIVAIADMNSLEAEVDVNEANVSQLGPNQPAEITVQAIPNHPTKACCGRLFPPRPDEGNRDRQVSILDKDKYLRPERAAT